MKQRPVFKTILWGVFFVGISVPYFIHPSQDLFFPVDWDEAGLSLNAKDIWLFGLNAIKEDRSYFILFPLKILLGLISFPVLGVSLFSLRLPYIILSVLGNLLFFDIIRKNSTTLIAVITTVGFVFYLPHLVMGKSAMADSLALSLTLILLWILTNSKNITRSYFWISIIGILILLCKIDNIPALIFLTGFVIWKSVQERMANNQVAARRILIAYLSGVALSSAIVLLFYSIVGWKNLLTWITYLGKESLYGSLSVLTPGLLIRNLSILSEWFYGSSIATIICFTIFIITIIYFEEARHNPLSHAIFFLLFLLLGKLSITVALYYRRFTPCLPLPFLFIAYIAFFLIVKPFNAFMSNPAQLPVKKIKLLNLIENFLVSSFLLVLIYIFYLPNMFTGLKSIILRPTYKAVEEAQEFSSVLKKGDKVLFLDGRFGYLAMGSPNKFVNIPPDVSANDFVSIEQNLPLLRESIKHDTQIKYVLLKDDNLIIRKILEEEFPAILIASKVSGCGVLYYINRYYKSSFCSQNKTK